MNHSKTILYDTHASQDSFTLKEKKRIEKKSKMNSFRLVPREKFLLGRRNEANFSDFSPNCHDQKWGLFRTFGSIESFSFQLGKSMK